MNALKAKPWAVLAMISLALNLFLGGLVLGKVLRPDRPPAHMGPISLFRASKELDPKSQELVDKVRDKHGDEIRERMGRTMTARTRAIDALCAEQFDEAAVRDTFDAFRKESDGAHDAMFASLVEVAKQMTPEQRKALGEALQKKGSGRRGKRGWSMGSDDPGPPPDPPSSVEP